jgi:DNA-binding CsgD family transcriptional regulator
MLDSSFAALDKLNFGIVLLSPAGTFVHWNSTAQAIARKTGCIRLGVGGRLRALTSDLTARLEQAICLTGAPSTEERKDAGVAVRLQAQSGQAVNVFVAPVQIAHHGADARVSTALFITDPAGALPSLAAALKTIYQMTPAEASLAEALASGRTLKEIAAERGVTMNTVRTQLQAVTSKVGVKRQADLVRAILTGPAVLHVGSRNPDQAMS